MSPQPPVSARAAAVRRGTRRSDRGGLGATLPALLLCCWWAGGCSADDLAPPDSDVALPAITAAAEGPPAQRTPIATEVGEPSGPRLRRADTTFDWGTIGVADELRHTFVLHNDGDRILCISRAKATRGSATVRFDREIPPGAAGCVELVLGPQSFRPGSARVNIELTTNASETSLLVLRGKIEN